MPVQKIFQYAGLARQTAKGSAAASPTYGFPTLGGGLLAYELQQDLDPLTWRDTYRTPYEAMRLAHNPAVALRTRCYLRGVGLLLYGALGSISTTGTTDYTHTITAAASLPYLTAWTQLGTERVKIADCKVDELVLSFDGRAPLEVEATLRGITPTFGESAFTPTTDETTGERLGPVGGTLKVDAGSGTPVVAKVAAGRIRFANGIQPVQLADSTLASDVFEGGLEVECEVRLVPDDFAEWRKVMTGSGSGTSISPAPVYGSLDFLFQISATKSLQIVMSRAEFQADFPEGDPGGGAVELTLRGRGLRTASAGPVTVTLKNQVASY